MADVVNDYFRRFYPKDMDRGNFEHDGMLGGMMRYRDRSVSTIFPRLVCADGFSMSVQGHAGSYTAMLAASPAALEA